MLNDYYRFRHGESDCVCLYWIFFDQQTHHLCYVDQIRQASRSFTVFHLTSANSEASTSPTFVAKSKRWLRKFQSPYSPRDDKEFELAFHLHLPVIAIASPEGFYMRNFNGSKPIFHREGACAELLLTPTGHDRMLRVAAQPGKVEYLSFSECGRYCTVS